MVEIDKYINNTENDYRVITPGNRTLRNTS